MILIQVCVSMAMMSRVPFPVAVPMVVTHRPEVV